MSMYGIDPEETADALDNAGHWDAANLMREMAKRITELESQIARVHTLADEIDTEMRSEPDTQRSAMQMEAVTRIRAALHGHPLAGQQPKEA